MKPPKLPPRWWLTIPVLMATAMLSWWLNRPPPEAEPPRVKAASPEAIREAAAPTVVAPAGAPPVAEAAPAPAEGVTDIFAVRNWAPPPLDAKPPVPQAPPLPFTFLGRIAEPAKAPVFMLAAGERVLAVSVGDSIGADYRLEKYENGQLQFLYRPMNVRQSLPAGNRS